MHVTTVCTLPVRLGRRWPDIQVLSHINPNPTLPFTCMRMMAATTSWAARSTSASRLGAAAGSTAVAGLDVRSRARGRQRAAAGAASDSAAASSCRRRQMQGFYKPVIGHQCLLRAMSSRQAAAQHARAPTVCCHPGQAEILYPEQSARHVFVRHSRQCSP